MNRDRLIMTVAILSGIMAFFLILHQLKQAKPKAVVVLAKRDLSAGTTLAEDMVVLSSPLPIKDKDTADYYSHPADVVGLRLQADLAKGKAVRRSMIKSPLTSVDIPQGMVVMTFTDKEVDNPPSFVSEGQYVDIMGFAQVADARGITTQESAIIQSVQIIALERGGKGGMMKGSKDEAFKSLSVALTPAEAELTTAALQRGKIRLALRKEPILNKGAAAANTPKKFSDPGTMIVIRGASGPVQTPFGASAPGSVGAPQSPVNQQPINTSSPYNNQRANYPSPSFPPARPSTSSSPAAQPARQSS